MVRELRGRLEWAGRFGLAGWARQGDGPAVLDVTADGRPAGQMRADVYRPDLAAAGEGDGWHAFEHWFAEPLAAGRPLLLTVTGRDGTHLPGSPMLLPGPPPRAAWRADVAGKLALVVDEADPDPARDAASAALCSHMLALRRLGYTVTFATRDGAAAALMRLAGRVRVAYLHRLRTMLALEPAVRAANPGVRVVFALADLASLRVRRELAVAGTATDGGTAAAALRGLERAEAHALAAADAVITHSTAEAAQLGAAWPMLRVAVVPWAVAPAADGPPLAQRRGIGFVGNFGHAPNRDAAALLLDAVMPLLWRHGAVPCVIAGYGMPRHLRARAGPLVELLDGPPDAAQAVWRRVRVSAAPLRFGAGVKGKVLDSLAHGVPCVCSPVAAEGLAVPAGLIAADSAGMAAALWRVHEDMAANAAAAAAGRAMLVRDHGEAAVLRGLRAALGA